MLLVATVVLTTSVGTGLATTPSAAPATADEAGPSADVSTVEVTSTARSTAVTPSDGGEIGLEVLDQSSSTVTVSLSTNAEGTIGYAAHLTFDADIVAVESIDGRDFDDPVTEIDDGRANLTQSTLPEQGVDAPEFATITFRVVESGETTIDFDGDQTIVETDDGDAAAVETRPLTLSVGDEDDGRRPGGVGSENGDSNDANPGGTDLDDGNAGEDGPDDSEPNGTDSDEDADSATDPNGGTDTADDSNDNEPGGSTDTTDAASDGSSDADAEGNGAEDDEALPGFTAVGTVFAFLAGTLCAIVIARLER